LSHDKPIISVDADGEFWVNPVSFTQRVLQVIETDFADFEGKQSGSDPLPTVVIHSPPAGPSPYLGTRGG